MSAMLHNRITNDRFANMTPSQIFKQFDDKFEKRNIQANQLLERIDRVKQLVSEDYMRYQYDGFKPPSKETLTNMQNAYYIVYGKLQRMFLRFSDFTVQQNAAIRKLCRRRLGSVNAVQPRICKNIEDYTAEKRILNQQLFVLREQRIRMISACEEMQFGIRILEYRLKFYSALVKNLIATQKLLSLKQLKKTHISRFYDRAIKVAGKESILKDLIETIEGMQPQEKIASKKIEKEETKECKIKSVKIYTSSLKLVKPFSNKSSSSPLRSSETEKTELRSSSSPTSRASSKTLVINDIAR